MLQILEVSKRYPKEDHNVLDKISFTVRKGEIFCIAGESGSGKTSLMRIIAGRLDKDSGEVLLNGKKIKGPSEQLIPGTPEIQIVHQDNKLYPNHSVLENLMLPLRLLPEEEALNKIASIVDICKLKGLEKKLPKELSGGQLQRVSLAQALCSDPEVLLMDEPFAHLDPPFKTRLKEDILNIIKTTGTTLVLVTHDAGDALSMADRIAVIKDGRILQTGTPENIYYQPDTPYTGSFFGEMNFITGEYSNTLKKLTGFTSNCECIGIRPGDIKLSLQHEETIQGVVSNCLFYGHYYEVTVKTTLLGTLRFYHESKIPLNSNIGLLLNPSTFLKW